MSVQLKRLLESCVPKGAQWAGLRVVRTSRRVYAAKDGRFDTAFQGFDEGCMVEVLHEGQFGYAAVGSLDPAALRTAAERALVHARAAAPHAVFRFSPDVRPATVLRFESSRQRPTDQVVDQLAGHALKLSGAMRISEKIVQAAAAYELRDIETLVVSTSGADIAQDQHIIVSWAQAVARDGAVTQRRTANGWFARVHQGGAELLNMDTSIPEVVQMAGQAIELLTAEECPSARTDLVLAPDQMMLQIHESVGHPLELDRILGDERNYAGSSFVKLSDIGTLRYGSPLMNITFDPTVAGEAACYGADDIGNKAQKEHIVRDGILVRALGSLESQARSGKPGVANQRAQDWYRPAIDRMANLNQEPGASSFQDIVSSIQKGIFMQTNRSWSIDDHRNKFQFGCEYARLIEDGKLTRTIRNPNYRGVSSSFWRSLFKVGDASTFAVFGTTNCGKGEPNQAISTGHASPVCAFRDVEVFGGES
jgi:predicted Zn-dependent protease